MAAALAFVPAGCGGPAQTTDEQILSQEWGIFDKGNYTATIDLTQQALATHQGSGDRLGEANDRVVLGRAEASVGRYADAIDAEKGAVQIDESLKNRADEATAFGNLGIVQEDAGRYYDALESQNSALGIFHALKNQIAEAYTLIHVGTIDGDLGRFDDDRAALQRAREIDHALQQPLNEADALTKIGVVDESLGAYDDAIAVNRAALAIYRQADDRLFQADSFGNIGIAETNLGRYGDALDAFEQALATYRDLGHQPALAQVLGRIGSTDYQLGRYDDALAVEHQSLAIDRAIPSARGVADDLDAIGEADHRSGRYDDAISAYGQAQAIHHELGDRVNEASDLDRYASVSRDAVQYDVAASAERKALAIDRAIGNNAGTARDLTNAGLTDTAIGNDGEALSMARSAEATFRALGDVRGRTSALRVEAKAASHLKGTANRDAALAAYRAALDGIESTPAGTDPGDDTCDIFNDALAYDEAISYLQTLDRQTPHQGYDREAFDVLEREQSRVVLDQISGSGARAFAGVPAATVARDAATAGAVDASGQLLAELAGSRSDAAALSSARRDAAAAASARASFERGIAAGSARYYALFHPQPATLADLQQHVLGPDEAMLAYDVLDKGSVAFVVTRDSFSMVPLAGGAAIEKAVDAVRSHIDGTLAAGDSAHAAADLPAYAAAGNALYKLVIPPAVASAIAHKNVIVTASGALYAVPWEALVTAVSPPHYFIEDHAVSYVSSASLLTLVRHDRHTPAEEREPLLAFARPAFGAPEDQPTAEPAADAADPASTAAASDAAPNDLATLAYHAMREANGGRPFADDPGADTEATAVSKALGAAAANVFAGASATRAEFETLASAKKLQRYRYLLFATPAVLPPVRGVAQPAIVLSHPERNGAVTLDDILASPLDADLVALSGSTAAPEAENGANGIDAMARALLYSGARSSAFTLWETPGETRARITAPFFVAMKSGASPAAALRRSKLALIASQDARLRHPAAWATMVVYGDGDLVRTAR